MGSVVTMIFFAKVDTYYDGAKDTQGARRRRLHRRWWLLPELPTAPPGGPPSNVFINYDGGATRAAGSTPRGPAIDVWLKT
jgi:hypothetical protein